MKKFFATILAIALFAALATIGLTIALIMLGLFAIWWAYLYFTGRRLFRSFESQLHEQMNPAGEPSTHDDTGGKTIEVEYEVVDEEKK